MIICMKGPAPKYQLTQPAWQLRVTTNSRLKWQRSMGREFTSWPMGNLLICLLAKKNISDPPEKKTNSGILVTAGALFVLRVKFKNLFLILSPLKGLVSLQNSVCPVMQWLLFWTAYDKKKTVCVGRLWWALMFDYQLLFREMSLCSPVSNTSS